MRILITFIILCTLVCTVCANDHSYYDLGITAYKRGHYQAALYDFETRAVKGDMIAQFCLGFMYKHGRSVIAENKKAMEWYERAAAQGYAPAQNDLGVMYVRIYESAKKNPKTLETAVKWFEKAAKQNSPPAQHNLGIIATSTEDRFKWWIQAASQEYAPSQRELGNLYYRGKDVVQNFTEAVKWYSKSATQENPDPIAQHNLGICYEMGRGVSKDPEAAFRYYKKAAEQGYTAGIFKLALAYAEGHGTDKNLKEAIKWYKIAAREGSVPAQNNLAAMYGRGEVIRKNSEIAKKLANEMAYRWYFQAAQQGESIAQKNIAVEFANNQDETLQNVAIPQNFAEAYYWYSLALKNKDLLNDTLNNKDLIAITTKAREKVGNQLSKEQRKEIQKQVDNWKPKLFGGFGTGFYIDKHYILTNSHVVTWEDSDGEEHEFDEYRIPYRRVELIAWEPELDLALLYDKSENKDTTTAIFRSQHVKGSEKISVFGYPQSDELSYDGNHTEGIVSGLSDTINASQPHNSFQHTAPTQRGNSGGPVFDDAGNVVGVSVSMLPDRYLDVGHTWQYLNLAQNINFAIKVDVIKDFLDLVKEDKDTLDFLKENKFLRLGYKSTEISDKDISLEKIRSQVEKMVVPVLCYKNKVEQPLDLIEVGIDKLNR